MFNDSMRFAAWTSFSILGGAQLVSFLGFTSNGIAASSMASALQSAAAKGTFIAKGNVTAGSYFAMMQSAAAKGTLVATSKVAGTTAVAAVGSGIASEKKDVFKKVEHKL